MLDVKLFDTIIRNNPEWVDVIDNGVQSLNQYFPKITQEHVREGSFYRYFGRVANHTDIVEISEYSYKKIKDNPRFVTAKVKWKIVGVIETTVLFSGAISYGVRDINIKSVEKADLTFNGLRRYIRDYIQYWVAEKI